MSTRFYKARRTDNLEWVRGYIWVGSESAYIIPHNYGVCVNNGKLQCGCVDVIKDTICEATGVEDKKFQMLYTHDIVESNFAGTRNTYEVCFQNGAYGLKWIHNDVEHFAAFTSFTDTVTFERVGNIYDVLDEKYYKMCASDAMAVDILKFIQKNYDKHRKDQPGCQKYIDALQIAINKISEGLSESEKTY